ncbi:MAG: ribonuclease P protein component [Corynebacterium sp.]|nr:ribonuclease P protein component [Corynebacterium sp.]
MSGPTNAHKLVNSARFRAITRRGTKAKGHYCIVYRYRNERIAHSGPVAVTFGGPRYGLIVTTAIGNAVTRHRVSRILREVCRRVINEKQPRDTEWVIRALPAIAHATYEEVRADVEHAIAGLG